MDQFKRHGTITARDGTVGAEFQDQLPRGNALYAFRQNDQWLYIGSAKSDIGSRIRSYINHQRNIAVEELSATPGAKRRQMHGKLTEYLRTGPVEIWAVALKSDQVEVLAGYPIHMRLGLEHGLICTYRPPLNEDTVRREC